MMKLSTNLLMFNPSPLLWYIFPVLVLWNSVAATELVIRPQNAVSLEGRPVTLYCSTTPNTSCHWLSKSTLDSIPLTVYDGDQQKLDNTLQYYVNTSIPGQCDLTVLKPSLSGPLVYACTDGRFGNPSYALLTVLKSNLLCVDNVHRGTSEADGQRDVRYSLQLIYSSEFGVSLYVEQSNGSVQKVCSDSRKDWQNDQVDNIWRLECDYTVDTKQSRRPHNFFAAVSGQVNVGIQFQIGLNHSLPMERFYCSNSDCRPELEVLTPANSTPTMETSTLRGDCPTCTVLYYIISILSLLIVGLCAAFGGFYCWHWNPKCKCRKIRQVNGEVGGENSKFIGYTPAPTV